MAQGRTNYDELPDDLKASAAGYMPQASPLEDSAPTDPAIVAKLGAAAARTDAGPAPVNLTTGTPDQNAYMAQTGQGTPPPPGAPPVAPPPDQTGGQVASSEVRPIIPAKPHRPAGPGKPDELTQGVNEQLTGHQLGETFTRAVLDQAQGAQAAIQQKQQEDSARYQAHFDREMETQTKLRDQAIQAANIDPHKFFDDKSALGKIFFSLGAMAKGVAGGAGGNIGAGSDFINQQIEASVNQQVKRAELLDKAASISNNLVQNYRNAGLDTQTAAASALATQKDIVATKIQQAAQRLGPGGVSSAYLDFAGKLHTEAANSRATIAQKRSETAKNYEDIEKTKAEIPGIQLGGIQKNQQTRADMIARQEYAAKGLPIPKELQELLSPEARSQVTVTGHMLNDKTQTDKVNDYISNTDPIIQKAQAALNYRNQHGPDLPLVSSLTGEKQQGKVVSADLLTSVMSDEGFKRLNPETQKIFQDAIGGDVGAWGRVAPALQKFIDLKMDERQSKLEAAGIKNAKKPFLSRPGLARQ